MFEINLCNSVFVKSSKGFLVEFSSKELLSFIGQVFERELVLFVSGKSI